ncbi:unnamed protein product [Musa banksii]
MQASCVLRDIRNAMHAVDLTESIVKCSSLRYIFRTLLSFHV